MTTPKQVFQLLHPSECAELQKYRQERWLVVAMNYALCEMANSGASQEQLTGVRTFMSTFQSLWEKNEPVKPMPAQTLKSYDRDTKE